MTFTPVGPFLFASTASLAVNNAAAGDLIAVSVANTANSTVWCTGLSGGGATWTPAGVHFSGTVGAYSMAVFLGRVTAAGAGTVTYTWSGTAPASWAALGQEFTSTAGSWAFRAQANLNGTDASWPSLVPSSSGQLYWGYSSNTGSAVAGGTAGYTYNVDIDGNGAAFNPACAAGVTTFPSFTDTNPAVGISVLIAEVSTYTPVRVPPGRGSPAAWSRLAVPQASPASAVTSAAPAALAAATSVPAPAVSAQQNASITPATLAVTTPVPAASFPWTLFGGQAPSGGSVFASGFSSDFGVQFTAAGSGNLLAGYSFWLIPAAPAAGSGYSFRLYSTTDGITGTLIGSSTVTGSGTWVPGAWNYQPLPVPVPLAAGTSYVAVVTQAASISYFYGTQYYFSAGDGSAGITSGPVTAPAEGAALGNLQGSLNQPSTGGMPHLTTDNFSNFWLDILITQPVSATVTAAAHPAVAVAEPVAFAGAGDAVVNLAAPLAVTTARPAPVVTLTPAAPATLAVTAAQPLVTTGTATLPAGNPAGGPWALAWSDEFTDPKGTGKPDPLNWSTCFLAGDMWRCNANPNEVEWYPHNLQGLSVSAGQLAITATKTSPYAIDPKCPAALPSGLAATYVSGMLSSRPGFSCTYGYAEARIQLPALTAAGVWPAFWMAAADANWPPESDIMETAGPPGASSTWWPAPGGGSGGSVSYPNDDGAFHVYGMRWTPTDVTYFYDGIQAATWANPSSFPMILYLNFAVTTAATGAGFPCSLNVDYVRVWQNSAAPAAPVITSISPADGKPTAGQLVVNFSTVSGATSYRATSCTTDYYADVDQTYATESLPRSQATGSASPLTITGLTNGVRYNVTAAAAAAGLYSPESAPVPALALQQTIFPSVLAVTTAIPQATASGNSVTVTPAVLAVATARPAPAVTGGTTGPVRLQSASATSAATTVAVAYGTSLSAGTKLIAAVIAAGGTGTPTVSDGTNTFTQAGGTPVASTGVGSGTSYCYLFALDTPAGDVGTTPVITATGGTAAAGMALLIQEVSGLMPGNAVAAMLDGTAGTSSGPNISAGANTTSPSYSSISAGEYLTAVYLDDGDSGSTNTGPAGYTRDPASISGNGASNVTIATKASTGGAESAVFAFTIPSGSISWGAVLVAFRLPLNAVKVTATAAITTPAVTAGGSATATPATLAVTTARPAPMPILPATLAVTAAIATPAVNTATVLPLNNPSGGPWVLAFADEFTTAYPTVYGGTGPNPAVWADIFADGESTDNNSNSLAWAVRGYYGCSVASSVLSLTTRFENPQSKDPACPNPMEAGGPAGLYTMAALSSHPGFAFTYGFIEALIKNPDPSVAAGVWGGIWLHPVGPRDPPEIDINEWDITGASQVNQEYYDSGGGTHQHTFAGDTSWHTYGLQLTPTTVTFYYDGVQTFSAPYDGNPYAWAVQLDNDVYGNTAGTGFPQALQIDYVRFWGVSGAPAQPVITSVSPASGKPVAGSAAVSFGTVPGATSYRVTATVNNLWVQSGQAAQNIVPVPTATGSSSPLTVTGLTNGYQYYFTVAAVNASGQYSIESLPLPLLWPADSPALPAVLAVSTAIATPAVTASTSVTITPVTRAVTTAQPAVTVSPGPGTLAVTTAQPAATVTPGPATLAVTTAQPQVTVSVPALPATLAVAAAFPAPTVMVPALPATLAVTAAFPAPGPALPATLAVTTAQPQVTVTAGGSANITPAVLAVTTAQPQVTVSVPALPAVLAVTTAQPAVTVSPGPGTLAVTTAQPAATVTPGPATLAVTTAQPAVTVSPGPATLAVATSVPTPAVTAGGNASIAPATVTVTVAIGAPVVRQDRTATPAILAVTVSFPAPAASGSANPAPAVLTILAAFPAPAASSGSAIIPAILAVTVAVPLPVPPFTVGTLTSATAPGGGAGGTLTASDQRTGGPS